MSLRKNTILVIGATLVGLVGSLSAASSTILFGCIQKVVLSDSYQQEFNAWFILWILLIGLIFASVALLVVDRLVLSRIVSLSADVSRISNQNDFSLRLSVRGKDELSDLAENINRMLAALEKEKQNQQEGEQLYRAVFDVSGEGIFLFDAQTGIVKQANAAFEQLLGYSTQEMLELTIYDLMASDKETIDRDIQDILAFKRPFKRQSYYRHRDGSLLELEVTASARAYGGEQLLCACLREIASCKQVEQALQQAEAKYRQIFENAAQGIYQSSLDGRYISANTALAKLYGYRSAEELMANVTNIGQQLYVDPNRYAKFVSSRQRY